MDIIEVRKRIDEIDKNITMLKNHYKRLCSFPEEIQAVDNIREDIDVIKNELRI